jgi:3-deoxy-D-manno-octulosonic-acid transferase
MLCELYQYFDCAYIGGGYEKSIHSVLEPFLMGAKVLCGPKIHRSTEYDYIHEVAPDEIVVLNNPNLFYTKWEELKNNKQGFDRLSLQISNQERMAKIIDLIG